MNASERIQRTKLQLDRKEPFFGCLLFNFRFKEVDETVCSSMMIRRDGLISYCKEFVEKFKTEEELAFTLKHETYHIVLGHHDRHRFLSRKQHYLMNLAEDAIVNFMLCNKEKMTCPEFCGVKIVDGTSGPKSAAHVNIKKLVPVKGPDGKPLRDDKGKPVTQEMPWIDVTVEGVGNKTAGEIYKELLQKIDDANSKGNGKDKDQNKDKQKSSGSGNPDQEQDADSGEGDAELPDSGDLDMEDPEEVANGSITEEDLQRDWKQRVATAAVAAKARGTLPGHLQDLVGEILEAKIPWHSVLRRYVTNLINHDTTWQRPSRRGLPQRLYLPSPKKTGLKLIVHIDTSGSCWHKADEFLSQIYWILSSVSEVELELVLCDAAIESIQKLSRQDLRSTKWRKKSGCGGTSHVPVVDWICKERSDNRLFISLTDGLSDIEQCYNKLPSHCQSLIILPSENKDMEQKLAQYCTRILVMND